MMKTETLNAFLNALTELSHNHHLAIGGEPVLYIMERDDNDRRYSADSNSQIVFG